MPLRKSFACSKTTFKSAAFLSSCDPGATGIMVAHTAHRCAQLPRASSVQSLPAIAGQQGLSSSHSRASLPLIRRCSTLRNRGAALSARRQADRVTVLVSAASTYENGYGSVGKPDEEVPAVDNSPTSAPRSPASSQPFYQPAGSASAPGALTRKSGAITWMCKV